MNMDVWLGELGLILLEGTLVLSAALFFARNQSASVRHSISLLALIGLSLLPVAILASKSWAIYRFPSRNNVAVATIAPTLATESRRLELDRSLPSRGAPSRSAIRETQPAIPPSTERTAPVRSARRKSADGSRSPTERIAPPTAIPTQAAVTPTIAPEPVTSNWNTALILVARIWLVGATIQLLRTVLGFVTAWRWRRNSHKASDPQIERLTCEAAVAVGLSKPPAVRISARATMPILIGLLRPVVVLPSQLAEQLDGNALRQVLIHEFAHYRRRDAWIGLWFRLVAIPFWFHPLAYRLDRMLHDTREELCDSVVVQTQPPIAYARTLLTIAESCRPRRLSAAGIGIVGMSLESRVARLLKPNAFSVPQRFARSRIPIMIALLVVGLSSQVLIAVEPSAASVQKQMPVNCPPEKCDEPIKEGAQNRKGAASGRFKTWFEFANTA